MLKIIKPDLLLYKVLPLIILMFLLIFSQLFYKERILFLDSSFKLFEVIRTDGLAIQAQRFPMAVTQVFPWVASHYGWDMEWVMRMYSASYIVWYAVAFILCGFWLHQWKIALAMPLFSILMCTQSFYWVSNELHQGIGFLLIQIALQEYYLIDRSRKWIIVLLILNTVNIIYVHPLAVTVYLSVLGYYAISNTTNRKWYVYGMLITATLYVCKMLILPLPVYDYSAASRLKSFLAAFPNYFTQPSQLIMYSRALDDYLIWTLLFLFTSGFLLFKKQWIKAGYYFLITIAYSGLITISIYNLSNQFYLEALLLPISLYTALVLILEVFDEIGYKNSFVLLVVIAAIRLTQIYSEHSQFTSRIDWMREFMAKTAAMDSPKIMIAEKKVPMDIVVLSWASPYEFWLLSALEYSDKSHCQLIIAENPHNYRHDLHFKNKFITTWGTYSFEELPEKYFNFTDTTNAYVEY